MKIIKELDPNTSSFCIGPDPFWDEFVDQVQHEHSIFWELYEDIAIGICEGLISPFSWFEIETLWIQTNEYWNWRKDEEYIEDKKNDVAMELYGNVWKFAADLETDDSIDFDPVQQQYIEIIQDAVKLLKETDSIMVSLGIGSNSLWDEIVYQIQNGKSNLWHLYRNTMYGICHKLILSLSRSNKEDLWAISDEFLEWSGDEEYSGVKEEHLERELYDRVMTLASEIEVEEK